MTAQTFYFQSMSSPIGDVFLLADEDALVAVDLRQQQDTRYTHAIEQPTPVLKIAAQQLGEYFNGQRKRFDVPLRFDGTPFQQQAWQALLDIPFGETRSYSEQAQAIGNPKAVRAIGLANSRNPIAIIVPCHRVIGKSGQLTGYAGGLALKQFLLQHEGLDV